MTSPQRPKPAAAGRLSRIGAAAVAVGLSVGLANGMALAAARETPSQVPPTETVIRRVVVPEPQPIVVVFPCPSEQAASQLPNTIQPPAPVPPPPTQTAAPAPVTESSGS